MILRYSISLFALVIFCSCSQPDKSDTACSGFCADANSFLAIDDVERVIAQAAAEANARGVAATIAVVDRVGNVLGVFRMQDAASEIIIRSTSPGQSIRGGLEEVDIVPDGMAAISKAITAAYLSTEGNAFSTRTASQIVQEHFNPGERMQPAGPLFGVQFSQLPCSDFMQRDQGGASGPGPQRSPLGLAADPGGLPLYRDGVPLGGVGVIADGVYGLDREISGPLDRDLDELIALAGSRGFEAPLKRRADYIAVDGKLLRFSDAQAGDLLTGVDTVEDLTAVEGDLLAVNGYSQASLRAGTAFGQVDSGIRPARGAYADLDGFVLVSDNDQERFAPRAGSDGEAALQVSEVETLLAEALKVANRARGQIRRPLGQAARVSISVVDTQGLILGLLRGRDAPVFGLDVSVQKARTATFYSGSAAAQELSDLPATEYFNGDTLEISDYVLALRRFLNEPTALADGAFAFADRSGGNLSRPFFPDGIDGNPPGPFSKPPGEWSPFSVGLQLDLVYNAIIAHVAFVAGLVGTDVAQNCTGVSGRSAGFSRSNAIVGLANGIQIFPGSVPVYRGSTLVGGIGVSGDGVDQDDMIAFLGVHNAAQILGTINNAPPAMRADNIVTQGVRLRYINCPQNPFLDSSDQEVCDGR